MSVSGSALLISAVAAIGCVIGPISGFVIGAAMGNGALAGTLAIYGIPIGGAIGLACGYAVLLSQKPKRH